MKLGHKLRIKKNGRCPRNLSSTLTNYLPKRIVSSTWIRRRFELVNFATRHFTWDCPRAKLQSCRCDCTLGEQHTTVDVKHRMSISFKYFRISIEMTIFIVIEFIVLLLFGHPAERS